MRVFVASMCLETNSFSPFPTGPGAYAEGYLYHPRPGDTLERCRVHASYSAYLQYGAERGHELIRGTASQAVPGGPMNKHFYESLRDELLQQLSAATPLDAVCLMLHGAHMAGGYDDCEGDLLIRIRDLLGPDIPVGVTLDLHANVSRTMLESVTIIAACKEYPHTDFAETARAVYKLVEQTVVGSIEPVISWQALPMLSLLHTPQEPGKSLVERARSLEGTDDLLSISLVHGFPWSDTSFTGGGVIVISNGNSARGGEVAAELGAAFFDLREADLGHYRSLDEALERALAVDSALGPVVIADAADNPGAGTAGDNTLVLQTLLERKITGATIAQLWDPVATRLAHDAGVGAVLPLRIGGKMGPGSGKPLDVLAEVTALAEDVDQRGPGSMRAAPLGDVAAIRVSGIDILLHTGRTQTFSDDGLRTLGIDPRQRRIIVVKSAQHFYECFSKFAAEIIYCDTAGTRSIDFANIPYRKITRPIWPLDEIQSLPEVVCIG